jgi:hypothetical protein
MHSTHVFKVATFLVMPHRKGPTMSRVTHVLEINQPPSIISKTLLDANNLGKWSPTIVSSTCSQESLKEGTNFSVKEDLKKIGGPKFEVDIAVEKLADKEIVWRQVKGPMERLEPNPLGLGGIARL